MRPLNAVVTVAMLLLTDAARAQEPPAVVATVKPVHSLVAQVMEGVGAPALLLDGAADPHSYALRPSDAKMLAGAKLLVMIGPEFETFLERPLKTLAGSARVLALASVADMQMDRGDQHLWLDPENAERAVLAIGRALTEIDPARGYEYARNAARARERIAALDRELREKLAPMRDKPFIVYHDAFRNFALRYRLRLLGALVHGAQRTPAARAFAEAVREAKAGTLCVFTEPQFAAAEAHALARETGARISELDDLGAAIPAGPEMYFTLMRTNAKNLVDCLSGPG
jgi:zinc transport system substrate-binding protein